MVENYFQEIATHYQVLLPAEILVLLTIAGSIALWKRVIKPFLDQRFKSYRQQTIDTLRLKILVLDYSCADEQRRLRALIEEGVYGLKMMISFLSGLILSYVFILLSYGVHSTYLNILYNVQSVCFFAGALFSLIQYPPSIERFYALVNYESYKRRFEARLQQLESIP